MVHIKLKDLVNIRTGYQMRERATPDPESDLRFIQVRDIDRGTFLVDADVLMTIKQEAKIKDIGSYTVGTDDVLFLAKGLRPGAFRVVHVGDRKIMPMSQFFILTVNQEYIESVDPRYLCWALNQPFSLSYVTRNQTGTMLPFISRPAMSELELPIPPLETQRRIVKIWELHIQERRITQQLSETKEKFINHLLINEILKN